MTLPTSGPLSLSDIQTEFGGTNPISLDEYYAGGAYVPAGTSGTYGAVPSSGAISIQNFYGTSNVVVNFTNQTVTALDFGSARAAYLISGATDGSIGVTIGNAYKNVNYGGNSLLEQWITPTTTAGSYEVYATLSGSSAYGTFNSWVAVNTNPEWATDALGSGTSNTSTITFQVRKIGTTTVLDTWTVTLEADAL